MAIHFTASRAIHRATFNTYPDGESSLSLQSRDLVTLPAWTRSRLGVELHREGVYVFRDGALQFDRELGAKRTIRDGYHGERFQASGAAVLSCVPKYGAIRYRELCAECCKTVKRSTFNRHLARLVALGTLHRENVKGRRETLYSRAVK